jgi:hypothetical protein
MVSSEPALYTLGYIDQLNQTDKKHRFVKPHASVEPIGEDVDQPIF